MDEKLVGAGPVGKLDEFFAKCFRSSGILGDQECEDRSLNGGQSFAAPRLIEEDEEEIENSGYVTLSSIEYTSSQCTFSIQTLPNFKTKKTRSGIEF